VESLIDQTVKSDIKNSNVHSKIPPPSNANDLQLHLIKEEYNMQLIIIFIIKTPRKS